MDCDDTTLPLRADPSVTRITYDEPTTGCCLPMPCCAGAQARQYNRINEDSLETNRACYLACCFEVYDNVSKQYLDMNPFKPTCFGLCKPQFASYKDSMYFLYCIPMSWLWDCCCKPCFGELVTVAPFYCDCCPHPGHTLCVRCCSTSFMYGTSDSQAFTEKLMAQVKASNAKGSHKGGAPVVADDKMARE